MPEPGDLGWLAAALVRTNFKETIEGLLGGSIELSGPDLSAKFPGVDLVCLVLKRSGVSQLSGTIARDDGSMILLTLSVEPSRLSIVSSRWVS